MSDRHDADTDNGKIKDPAEWVTGDEPMTGAQESYVHTLARQAGEEIPDEMTKAEASEVIEELREKTGKAGASKGKAKAKAVPGKARARKTS